MSRPKKNAHVVELRKLMSQGMRIEEILEKHPELGNAANELISESLRNSPIGSGSSVIHVPERPQFE